MNAADFQALAPLIVLSVAAVLLMLLIAVWRSHAMAAWASAIGLVTALASVVFVSAPRSGRHVTPLLIVDDYALFYIGLVIVAALAVSVISHGYLKSRDRLPCEEYYVLLLLATLGAATTVAADHFAAFFLGLETLSIALLGLIAYPHVAERPVEAGVKYLVLAGVASAFLLFGIALVYAQTGTLSFAAQAVVPAAGADARGLYWLSGVALILVGIGFKLSVVPFHMWAPDVYEGAPAPVTAFLAVVSKCAVFALLLRYFLTADAWASAGPATILSIIAVLSMIAGNLLALLQDNVKRILAYSSIAHLGYALVALLAGGALAVEAVSVYLAMYAVTTLGAFGVVTILSRPGAECDADTLEDYRGLFWVRPWLALAFAAMLLSLAGIPLTLGFIAKFYAVASGVSARLWLPVVALVIGSIIGLYYYLRIIVAMLSTGGEGAESPARLAQWPACAVIAILTLALLGLGIFPSPLVAVVRATAADLAERTSALPGLRPAASTKPSEQLRTR
ncbi:MAG: NADH-quinone oxidoreductase subunit N [Burkholderiales bacterium]